MGDVLRLSRPIADQPADCGMIHVYRIAPDTYEVGHESAGGNSWGYFSQHTDAAEAISAAVRLNMETFGGGADLFIPNLIRHEAETRQHRTKMSLTDLLGPVVDPTTGGAA